MTRWRAIALDREVAIRRAGEFAALLAAHPSLDEAEVRAFLAARPALVAATVLINYGLRHVDRWAPQVDLGGKHMCDVAAGSSRDGHYTLVELEDATPTSVYKAEPATPYTSDRFNRGFAQIVDWLCLLDGQRRTPQSQTYWGREPDFTGLLVIGRSAGLDAEGRHRLEWRSDHVRVNGRPVLCMTYDDFVARLAYAVGDEVEDE